MLLMRFAHFTQLFNWKGYPLDINASANIEGSHKAEPFSFSSLVRRWKPRTANPVQVDITHTKETKISVFENG